MAFNAAGAATGATAGAALGPVGAVVGGLAGGLLGGGGGGGSAPSTPLTETNTTGAKTITFNNNKGVATALYVIGGGALLFLIVRELRRK